MARILAIAIVGMLLALAGCGGDEIDKLAEQYGANSQPYHIGNDVQFTGAVQNLPPAFLHTVGLFNVPAKTTLIGLGVIVWGTPPPQGRMAVYTNDMAPLLPLGLVAGSGLKPISSGRNEFGVTHTPLPAGDYWIGFNPNGPVDLIRGPLTAIMAPMSLSTGSPWPDPFIPSGSNAYFQLNYYMIVQD